MASSAEQAREALNTVTESAVAAGAALLAVSDDPNVIRLTLLDTLPALVEQFSDGTAALAADYYDDTRSDLDLSTSYSAEPVVKLRPDKLRIGALWIVKPLSADTPEPATAVQRLADVIQLETARPFRDTVTANVARDPSAVGWRRIAAGGCTMCRFLANRGAVYREATANFATHPHCHCTAAPVFGDGIGEEASALQYVASNRRRTQKQRQTLRDALNEFESSRPYIKQQLRDI